MKLGQRSHTTDGTLATQYSYDKNGSLTSKAMGERTDTYSYDAMNQLTAYTGYDGYQQRYTYNAQGMMSAKEAKGDSNRATLEEIVSGKGSHQARMMTLTLRTSG